MHTFSSVDLAFVKQYMRIEPDWTEDDFELEVLMDAAKDFIIKHSSMTVDELDANKYSVLMLLKMISERYITTDKLDPMFELLRQNLRNYNI